MYNPYSKGKWYRLFLESDGVDYTLTNNDIVGGHISGQYFECPEGFHVVDCKFDINTIVNDAAEDLHHITRVYADGTQAIILPKKTKFDWAYIYVFGYYA